MRTLRFFVGDVGMVWEAYISMVGGDDEASSPRRGVRKGLRWNSLVGVGVGRDGMWMGFELMGVMFAIVI